jgi:regulatory protein
VHKPPKLLERDALFAYSLKALGARNLSIGELREKLRKRAVREPDVDEILSQLKQLGYLNDRRFADSVAAHRRDHQGLGQARVLRDLRLRRVPRLVAEAAVADAFRGTDEGERIAQYLERKYRGKDLAAFLQEEKNLASAYRRLRTAGFSSGASIRVLKRYAAQAEALEGLESDEPDAGPEAG